jgi:hypothetical protein
VRFSTRKEEYFCFFCPGGPTSCRVYPSETRESGSDKTGLSTEFVTIRYITCAIFSSSSCRHRSEQLMDSMRNAALRASWVETP